MSALGAGAQGCGGTGLAGALSQIEQGVRQVPGAVRVPAKQPPIGAPECWRDLHPAETTARPRATLGAGDR